MPQIVSNFLGHVHLAEWAFKNTIHGHHSRSFGIELHYFLCFRIKNLSIIEIAKLTITPKVAKITVFTTSSEFKFGIILKKVPPAVPTKAGLLDCIFS
jgi:hypothetical protein